MKIKIFNTEIYISFLFAAVVSFLLLTDRTGLIVPTISAVLLHETGHLFAMWAMDCSPKAIRLVPASVQIIRSFSPKPHGESIIALCGPLCNLVLFITLWLHFTAYKNDSVMQFAILNLILGIFNLLPVCGLDGGIIFFNLLCRITNEYCADRILRAVTFVLSAAILAAGLFLTAEHRFNISAFIAALYLFIAALIKQ